MTALDTTPLAVRWYRLWHTRGGRRVCACWICAEAERAPGVPDVVPPSGAPGRPPGRPAFTAAFTARLHRLSSKLR